MTRSVYPLYRIIRNEDGELLLMMTSNGDRQTFHPLSSADLLQLRDDATRILTTGQSVVLSDAGSA